MRFAPLRGFDDHLPPDAGARSEILGRMRAAARLAGFQELEPPSVESLELFTAKSGAEIAKELWSFTDKGGRAVALITESTPSLARIYAERASAEPLPVKWFTVARVWRYQEPQAGRAREFHQFNLDILGASGLEAEVELLSVGAMLLDSAGAAGLYGFRLSDRPLVESIGRTLGATDLPRFFRALDSLRKVPAEATRAELLASGVSPEGVDRLWGLLERSLDGVPLAGSDALIRELAGWSLAEPGPAGLDRLRRLAELLPRAGVGDRVRLDLSVVRGLDYYTGPVFEAYDLKGEGRALFGGGRYDTLIESFGGPPTPACGLAIGDLTLELLLRAHGRWPAGEPPLDTFVVAVTPEMVPQVIELLARLRRSGVVADADLLGRSLSRQLKEAARRRARRALLVGPRELARGAVLERDLGSGAQTERPLTEVAPGA